MVYSSTVFLISLVIVNCSRLNRLEKRLSFLENKVLYESKFFQDDIEKLFEGLNTTCDNTNIKVPHVEENKNLSEEFMFFKTKIEQLVNILQYGFANEKKLVREHARLLEENLKQAKEVKENMKLVKDDFAIKQNVLESSIFELGKNLNKTNNLVVALEKELQKQRFVNRNLKNELEQIQVRQNEHISDREVSKFSLAEFNVKWEKLTQRLDDTNNKFFNFIPVINYNLFSGIYRFQSSIYFFSKSKAHWQTAKINCESVGAYLVEINSREENYYLKEVTFTNRPEVYVVWLGGTYHEEKDNWIWNTSFTEMKFYNWGPHVKDTYVYLNLPRKTLCPILFMSGFWDLDLCEITNNIYICEKQM